MVFPIYNSGNRLGLQNCYPVKLLSIVSKVIGSLIDEPVNLLVGRRSPQGHCAVSGCPFAVRMLWELYDGASKWGVGMYFAQ